MAEPSGSIRFIAFQRADAVRLTAFNASICADLKDARAFEEHDQAFYERYTGDAGWTLGYVDDDEILTTTSFIFDLAPFRENWVFPAEEKIFQEPAVWGCALAIAPRARGTGVVRKRHPECMRFIQEKGIKGCVSAVFPSAARAHFRLFENGMKRIVGFYYDSAGLNYLYTEQFSLTKSLLPEKVDAWRDSTDEAGISKLLEDRLISLTARKTDEGFEIGFGRTRSEN